MIEFGGEIDELIEGEGFKQPGFQVTIGLHQGLGMEIDSGQVTNEGEQIPAGHQ